MTDPAKKVSWLGGVTIILLTGGLAYSLYLYQARGQELTTVKQELASTTQAFSQKVIELELALATTTEERSRLADNLQSEQRRSSEFEEEIENLDDKVDMFEKLSKTDPQLLQKYSKVFFLNEHYLPAKLVDIPAEYLSLPDKPQQFHSKVWRHLRRLLEEATEDGITLKIVSAYRSFGTQATLKSNYKVIYGAGSANQFSADQGYSEHQLGTALDFTSPGLNAALTGFDKSAAFQWLTENAYRYGFILSYPVSNAYYQFEPWHWRFVGVDLARDLHRQEKNFYDLDQREIDKYLISFFD
ncbi:MAG: D-alanyl-D-alanine carboxypeptidase family protein [Patescibacteria group bacterium]